MSKYKTADNYSDIASNVIKLLIINRTYQSV